MIVLFKGNRYDKFSEVNLVDTKVCIFTDLNYDKRVTMFNTFRDLTAYWYINSDQDANSISEVDIMPIAF